MNSEEKVVTGRSAPPLTVNIGLVVALVVLSYCFRLSPNALAQYSAPSAKSPALDILFVDKLHGWIVKSEEDRAVVYRTEDSGDTWARIETLPPIYKLFFLNPMHGWALARHWTEPTAVLTTLYETSDGGQTWSKRATILPAKPGSNSMITDFWFLDELRGWFVGQGELGSGIALATSDGGKTVHPDEHISKEETIRSIFGLGTHKLWVFGLNTIVTSSDGGGTWNSQFDSLPSRLELGYIGLSNGLILNSGIGWAVGQAGGAVILQTQDFGRTWTASVKSGDGNSLDSISFGDSDHGYAVGRSTILYCTSDAGRTWTTKRTLPRAVDPAATKLGIQVDNGYKKVWFTGSRRGLVISEGGFLFQTDDGGDSWREASLASNIKH